jgi:hypothetical protein
MYYNADSHVCGVVAREIFHLQMVAMSVTVYHQRWDRMILRSHTETYPNVYGMQLASFLWESLAKLYSIASEARWPYLQIRIFGRNV